MSLSETPRKFSRREIINIATRSAAAGALSSCIVYNLDEAEDTQNGTRGLRADGQPRSGSQIQTDAVAPLNEPKISKEIMVPVKSYTSDFRGSEPNRIHNIREGSNALNNWFWEFEGTRDACGELNKRGKNQILPGESFNLGSVIEKAPYVKGGAQGPGLQTIEVDGGGICQISSTLNTLALRSGLQIDVRRNHSYYNGWYFGNRMDLKEFGMDATIFIPGQDWVITNNFPYPIRFLLTECDQRLTASVYTTADFVPLYVEIDGPTMTWPNHYDEVEVKGRLAKDVVKDLKRPFIYACGTTVTQRVYVPGKWRMNMLIFEKQFESNYQTSPYPMPAQTF